MGLSTGKIHVIVNNTPLLEYDRSKPVPGIQRRYLDSMDAQMEQGIEINGNLISKPDSMQRSQFVANSMINALSEENYSVAIAMCTWLGERIPELKQVQAIGNITSEMRVDMVFDRDYEASKTEQAIKFHKPTTADQSTT